MGTAPGGGTFLEDGRGAAGGESGGEGDEWLHVVGWGDGDASASGWRYGRGEGKGNLVTGAGTDAGTGYDRNGWR